jgi:ankyrin repeat protein
LFSKFSSVRSSDRFFPPKKVTNDDKVTQERKELFQTWFVAIFSDSNVVCDTIVMEFLLLSDMQRAIAAGDDRYFGLLLSARVPLAHASEDPGFLPLHTLCKNGFVECVEVLLRFTPPQERSALLCKLDDSGMSPLHTASAQGHVRVASLLLDYGALPTQISRSAGTLLHTAVRYNRPAIIDLLVAAIVAGGDSSLLDVQDCKGRSPLHYAVHFRMREAVMLLLKSGANVVKSEQHDRPDCSKTGHTVMHVAAALNDHDIMRVRSIPSAL